MTRSSVLLVALLVVACKPEDTDDPPPQTTPTETVPPETITPIGSPLWQIGDFAVGVGPSGEGTSLCLLGDSGNHSWDGSRWVPGDPHDGPYTDEMRSRFAACGLEEQESFDAGDITAPNALWLAMVLTPLADQAQGSSPDFSLGDVIYEDRFPMVIDGDVRRDGLLVDSDNDFTFPTTTELGHLVTGHSHVPILMQTSLERMPAGASPDGAYQWQISLRDGTSTIEESGYDFTYDYVVAEGGTGTTSE